MATTNTLPGLMQLPTDPRLAVLILLLLIAAAVDLRRRRIPNALVLTGLCYALILASLPHSLVPQSVRLPGALAGAAVGFALTLPFYLLRGMAAGDVKLMTMVGAFLGPGDALMAVLWSFLAGGVLALVVVLLNRRLRVLGRNLSDAVATSTFQIINGHAPQVAISRAQSAGMLPFGVAIAGGTMAFILARAVGLVSHV